MRAGEQGLWQLRENNPPKIFLGGKSLKDVKKTADRGSGRAIRNRTGKAQFLFSRVPPDLSSGRHGLKWRVRRVGDIYCFKLSPLLSSPCQEVFEDRKYSGDFVSGVNRNLWVAREFKACFPVLALAGISPRWIGPFRSPLQAVGSRAGRQRAELCPVTAPKGAWPTSGEKLPSEGGCGQEAKLSPPLVCLAMRVRGGHPTPIAS